MRYRALGRTGWQVSEIGFGTWGAGAWSDSDDQESIAAMERAVELGCNFFDTAWVYGLGKSETLLGSVLRNHRTRRPLVATKVPPKNMRWPGAGPVEDAFPPEHIHEYTRRSLQNLGVEQIDLQQFHVWSDEWANDPGWQRAVRELKEGGRVRAFGVSVNRWEPTNVLRTLDTGLIDSVQVVYNIFDQAPEDELFPYCEKYGIALIARVPFDEGTLTGTLTRDSRWPADDWRSTYLTPDYLAEAMPRVERLQPLVPAGMNLPELALRFILEHRAVSTTIPGMRRVGHVEGNMAASDGEPLPTRLRDALRAHRWNRRPSAVA